MIPTTVELAVAALTLGTAFCQFLAALITINVKRK